jgi:hypothetical protein
MLLDVKKIFALWSAAQPLLRNALDRKLSCSLQDSAGGACGLAGAGLAGSALRTPGETAGTGGNNRDGPGAISCGCRELPERIRGHVRSSGDGNLGGVVADNRNGRKRFGRDENGKVGTVADNSGSVDRSSGNSSVELKTPAIVREDGMGPRIGLVFPSSSQVFCMEWTVVSHLFGIRPMLPEGVREPAHNRNGRLVRGIEQPIAAAGDKQFAAVVVRVDDRTLHFVIWRSELAKHEAPFDAVPRKRSQKDGAAVTRIPEFLVECEGILGRRSFS